MLRPSQIDDTGLWVETNLSARDIIKLSTRLLLMFGHTPDDAQITLE